MSCAWCNPPCSFEATVNGYCQMHYQTACLELNNKRNNSMGGSMELNNEGRIVAHREFITKDSGQRQEFSTGMKRDVQTNKPRYDLLDRPLLKRWAELMARGAEKYGENNWRKAATQEEMDRFDASLLRHVFQLLDGDRSEDHSAAICFNVAGREMVLAKLNVKECCGDCLVGECICAQEDCLK